MGENDNQRNSDAQDSNQSQQSQSNGESGLGAESSSGGGSQSSNSSSNTSGGNSQSGSGAAGYNSSARGNNARGNGRGYGNVAFPSYNPHVANDYEYQKESLQYPEYQDSGIRYGQGGPSHSSQNTSQNRGQGRSQSNMSDTTPLENNENNNMNCNQPTILAVPGYGGLGNGFGGGYSGGFNGGIGIQATQAMQPVEDKSCEILMSIGDVRGAVKDAESRTGDNIHHLQDTLTNNQFTTLGKIGDVEKEAIRNNGELKASILATENNLARQIEECCCDMKMMNLENKHFITEKFCDLERRQDKEFDRIREREDKREIFQLREEKSLCLIRENNALLAKQIVSELLCAGLAPVATTHTHK